MRFAPAPATHRYAPAARSRTPASGRPARAAAPAGGSSPESAGRLHRQLGEVLADSTGQIRPELQALHDALATTDRPDTITNWLTRPTVRSVLVDLATGQRPLTHATLDDLPPSKAVEHLRSVLVATAALPAHDEQLARLQRWITQTLTERTDPRDRELLRRYAVWHELRRIRQRNRGTETT